MVSLRMLAVIAVVGGISTAHALPVTATTTSCPTSDSMTTGANGGAWYTTVSPSEHFDSGRSQLFPNACNLSQITNSSGPYTITTRTAPGSYPNAYNIATRDQSELFVYGGFAGQGGSYVAKLDADSLSELWRAKVTIPSTQWSFIGAMGVLGDGNVYSIQSNVLAKINPATGQTQLLNLPQLAAPTGTGAAYNGFVVTPSGLIVAKSMERGSCSNDTTDAIYCVIKNNLPATVVVVNPATMTVVASINTTEAALGRIMTERHNGIDYIYIPGLSKLVRYQFYNGSLSLDTSWGPITYGSGANASGVGLMNGYAVAQTNYVASMTPSYVIAASITNSSQHYLVQPFLPASGRASGLSWVPDKAALDTANNRIYAEDTYAGKVAALTIGSSGLQIVWSVTDTGTGFPALVGPSTARQLVVPNFVSSYDTLDWRNVSTGAAIVQSPNLASQATVGASAPGFKGRFYYPSFSTGQLIELTP